MKPCPNCQNLMNFANEPQRQVSKVTQWSGECSAVLKNTVKTIKNSNPLLSVKSNMQTLAVRIAA